MSSPLQSAGSRRFDFRVEASVIFLPNFSCLGLMAEALCVPNFQAQWSFSSCFRVTTVRPMKIESSTSNETMRGKGAKSVHHLPMIR